MAFAFEEIFDEKIAPTHGPIKKPSEKAIPTRALRYNQIKKFN